MKTTIQITAIVIAAMTMSFTSTNRPSKQNTSVIINATPVITWKTDDINLGEIPQSKPVTIDFEFTNSGKDPVIISDVKAACGCTATDYSRLPVLPGQTTKITATFNAAAKGAFKKTVTVITNAEESPKVLSFSGTVI